MSDNLNVLKYLCTSAGWSRKTIRAVQGEKKVFKSLCKYENSK